MQGCWLVVRAEFPRWYLAYPRVSWAFQVAKAVRKGNYAFSDNVWDNVCASKVAVAHGHGLEATQREQSLLRGL